MKSEEYEAELAWLSPEARAEFLCEYDQSPVLENWENLIESQLEYYQSQIEEYESQLAKMGDEDDGDFEDIISQLEEHLIGAAQFAIAGIRKQQAQRLRIIE